MINNKSVLIYGRHLFFYKLHDIKKFGSICFEWKYILLATFSSYLDKFRNLKAHKKVKTNWEETNAYNGASDNYIMTCFEHILINTMIYQILEEVK